MKVTPEIKNLMQKILSTKPATSEGFWIPSNGWLQSPEVKSTPALWGITLTQWILAWEEHKVIRQQHPVTSPDTDRTELRLAPSPQATAQTKSVEQADLYHGDPSFVREEPSDFTRMSDETEDSILILDPLLSSSHSTPKSSQQSSTISFAAVTSASNTTASRKHSPNTPGLSRRKIFPTLAAQDSHDSLLQHLERSPFHLPIQAAYAAQRKRGRGFQKLCVESRDSEEVSTSLANLKAYCAEAEAEAEGSTSFNVLQFKRFSLSDPEQIMKRSSSLGRILGLVWMAAGQFAWWNRE